MKCDKCEKEIPPHREAHMFGETEEHKLLCPKCFRERMK